MEMDQDNQSFAAAAAADEHELLQRKKLKELLKTKEAEDGTLMFETLKKFERLKMMKSQKKKKKEKKTKAKEEDDIEHAEVSVDDETMSTKKDNMVMAYTYQDTYSFPSSLSDFFS